MERDSAEEEDRESSEDDVEGIEERLTLGDAVISDSESEEDEDDADDELPPILEPRSTGYLYSMNPNLPPPELQPMTGEDSNDSLNTARRRDRSSGKVLDVIDLEGDSDEGSTATDTDDELVKVDYLDNPPEGFIKALKDYKHLYGKEQFMYNVKNLYRKQPHRIKRLFKMHKDAEGNPVEESLDLLFERIHAEREQMKVANNVKPEPGEEEAEDGVASVVPIKVENTAPQLTHVLYPGNVVNVDKAVATLGGIGTISKTFDQPSKKLVLKFRPQDPFANGVHAQGHSSCGLLISVKHRKPRNRRNRNQAESTLKDPSKDQKINLDDLGEEPVSTEIMHDMLLDNQLLVKPYQQRDEPVVLVGGKTYTQEDLLMEDRKLQESQQQNNQRKKAWRLKNMKEYNLNLPKSLDTRLDPNVKIETLGIIQRSYEFNGICDFQYLPVTKKGDGKLVSIKDKIFPILGAPDSTEKLVMKELLEEQSPCQPFSLPPAMCRVDTLPRSVIEDLLIASKADQTAKKLPPDDSVFSNRMKRIIYTVSYNFQADATLPDNSQPIPTQPLSLALKDMERRQIKKDLIESVRQKFKERPIWSKVALQFATKIPNQTLKYIIPNFAYFASNGPWRNTWIRFGCDPRKNPINVVYQSVDFRIPFIYRRFMNIGPKNPEANHKFFPKFIPPKTQMFYQLCDIKIEEVNQLILTLERLASLPPSNTLKYDERYGFLKEGSYEYFRYIMNYYLENLLQEFGKLPLSKENAVFYVIPPGHIEPEEKVKAAPNRRIKTKRIRKSTKKPTDYSPVRPSSSHSESKSPSPKKKGDKGRTSTVPQYYQQSIEDLALNNLPFQSANDDEEELSDDDEEDDDDYDDEDYVL